MSSDIDNPPISINNVSINITPRNKNGNSDRNYSRFDLLFPVDHRLHPISPDSPNGQDQIKIHNSSVDIMVTTLPYLPIGKYKTYIKCIHGNYVQFNRNSKQSPLYTSGTRLMNEKWILTLSIDENKTVYTSIYDENDKKYIGSKHEKLCSYDDNIDKFKIVPVLVDDKSHFILVTKGKTVVTCDCVSDPMYISTVKTCKFDTVNNTHLSVTSALTLEYVTDISGNSIGPSIYQELRLDSLRNMSYLPVGKIASIALFCRHGLQVSPSRDSVLNPSVTSAIQTMNILPREYVDTSMTVYDNEISNPDYLKACTVQFEYQMQNKRHETSVHVVSIKNDRLWIENVKDTVKTCTPKSRTQNCVIYLDSETPIKESAIDIDVDSSRRISNSGLSVDIDASKFTLIPHVSGGVTLQAANKYFVTCMCPNLNNLNDPLLSNKDHICYGMSLRNSASVNANPSCVFTIKLKSTVYGRCGYLLIDEEHQQRKKDLQVLPSIPHIDYKIPIYHQDMNNVEYTRDYIIGDYNPLLRERGNYFVPDANAKKNVISVFVPCFTEPAKALRRTLIDLEIMQRELSIQKQKNITSDRPGLIEPTNKTSQFSDWEINVLVLCDGWFKADRSLRRYITSMLKITEDQAHKLLEWEIDQDSTTGVQTMILQRVRKHNNKTELIPIEVSPGIKLKVSVLIKRDNRRKHNSHEWFLYTFAPLYCISQYMDMTIKQIKKFDFLTDCGTRFHPACLTVAVDELINNDNCMGASGRQRVMSESMQNSSTATYDSYDTVTVRKNKSPYLGQIKELFSSSLGFLYRASQCFDYEASISCFNGGFSAAGMLPVVPGPCGMFRQDVILDEGLENLNIKHQRIQQETLRQILLKLRKIQIKLKSVDRHLQSKLWMYIKDDETRIRKQINNTSGYSDNTFVANRDISMKRMQAGIQSLLNQFSDTCESAISLIQKIVDRIQVDKNCKLLSDDIILHAEKISKDILDYVHRMPEVNNLDGSYDLQIDSWDSLWKQVPNSVAYNKLREKIQERDTTIVQMLGAFHTSLSENCNSVVEIVISRLKETASYAQLAGVTELEDTTYDNDSDTDDTDPLNPTDPDKQLKTARDPYDLYFQTVNKIPEECGAVEGSLLLAEDRVFSYAVVMTANRQHAYTTFLPNAIFYFEAETESEPLLGQRRRWINGTVAGYIWLLLHWRMFDFNLINFCRLFLIALQLLVYAIVAISPCLWALGMHFSLGTVFEDSNTKYNDWVVILYLLFYILFVYAHTEYRDPKQKLFRWMLHVFTFIHFFATIIIGLGLIISATGIANKIDYYPLPTTFLATVNTSHVEIHNSTTPYTEIWENIPSFGPNNSVTYSNVTHYFNNVEYFNVDVWTLKVANISVNVSTPYYVCDSDWTTVNFDYSSHGISCWGTVRVIIMTTIFPFILAFLYDVYWYLPCDPSRSVVKNFRFPSCLLMILTAPFFYLFLPTMVGTFGVYAFSRTWDLTWGNKPSESLYSLGSTVDKSKTEQMQRETLQSARFVSYFIVFINIFMFLLVVLLEMNKYILGIATVFVLMWGIFQMLLSGIWISYKIVKRLLLLECCCRSYSQKVK